MKNRLLIGLVGLLGLAAASAQIVPKYTFNLGAGGGGEGPGNTNSYAIISAQSVRGGAPIVTYVDATSDNPDSVIQCYRVGYIMNISDTSTSTNLYVNAVPKGADVAGVLVLRHTASDTYERLYSESATATNLVTTVAPTDSMVVGDTVYFMLANGKIPCGAANKAVSGPGIFIGQRDLPLLIEVDGTNACSLNAVCAGYQQ